MAAQSCTWLTRMLRRSRISREKTHPFDTDIRWLIYFPEIQIQTRRHRDRNLKHREGYCHAVVGPVPEIDTTVASQSSYTKIFASVGSFQDVCGDLIGVGQDRPVQNPPFIPNLLWTAFRIFLIIQEINIAEKKSKSTKNFTAADNRRLAANKKARPISIDFETSFVMHCG